MRFYYSNDENLSKDIKYLSPEVYFELYGSINFSKY